MSEHLQGVLQGALGATGVLIALYAYTLPESKKGFYAAIAGILLFVGASVGPQVYAMHFESPGVFDKSKHAMQRSWDGTLKFLRLRKEEKK